ncbi:MAG: winged helix DNA-binding domain-containing protein [Candidatus Bathyarchaeota archaeon]|nr:winged helix DNA-binding domain-containing protein [Candidatus Bathyarchaeota archaeon]
MEVSKETARRLMIEKQGIDRFPDTVSKDNIYETIDSLGCLQIDTINVIERAHYLTLWSRLGSYDKLDLHTLTYRDKKLFEYWAHAACYVPIKDYRHYIHSMNMRRDETHARLTRRGVEDHSIIDKVLNRIKDEGPLSSKDFDGPKRSGSWWNWKPAKLVLETLFGAGTLMVSHRENFQRYYDLTENVLPSQVDTSEPTDNERVRFFTLKTLECLGLTKPSEIRKYYHHRSVRLDRTTKELEKLLTHLVSEGIVEKMKIEGDKTNHYILTKDRARLDALTSGDFAYNDARPFIYFDNLMWNRERIQQLFGFKSKLEIYLPKDQRVYGYYHLPILYGDELVARIEPKMDRQTKTFIIRGYWTEPGFKATDDYEDKLHKNIEKLAEFHGAEQIEWQVER